MQHFGYEHVKETVTSPCLKEDALTTNLNIKPAQQYYQLADGTICTGINHAAE